MVRHSYDRTKGRGAIHRVSAWASANQLVIGQRKVEDKSRLDAIADPTQLQDTVDELAIERSHLKEISEKDALTKIFNRAAGEQMLQTLIDQSIPIQNIGIIICDIDRFKHINDTYGHLVGDRVLLSTAQSCQVNLRKQDTLVRWGGEEFLVVVSGGDSAELVQLAERLRQMIANQSIPDVGSITASFGVAFRQPQEDRLALFSRADRALSRAKALTCIIHEVYEELQVLPKLER